jgi:hypothetical protein
MAKRGNKTVVMGLVERGVAGKKAADRGGL